MNDLNSEQIMISIAIPVYNGNDTLALTLDNIIAQINKNVEIIICDDFSADKTYEIAMSYSHYDFVRVFKNDSNLGMDKNFEKTAKLCNGKFVWFFGQDDQLYPGSIDKVVKIIRNNKNLGIVYLNYDQYDNNLEKILNKSYLSPLKKINDKFKISKNEYRFKDYNDFFNNFFDLPSFLPATIINKNFWEKTDLKLFYNTCYIQVAMMYLNMDKGSIYVCLNSIIKGRIPNNKWQSNGQKHFEILTGFLKMQKTALDLGAKIPLRIVKKYKNKYMLNFFFHILLCKNRGFKPKKNHLLLLENIFGKGFILSFYMKPVLFSPLLLLKILNFIFFPLKKIMLIFLKYKFVI